MARIRTLVACVAAGLLGAGIVAALMAAPAPPPAGKAEKWEYAEVQHHGIRIEAGRRARKDTPHWVTAEEDIEADSWADLAAKLKAPVAKKAATGESYRFFVFNHLAAEGWEFAGYRPKKGEFEIEAWLFRRK